MPSKKAKKPAFTLTEQQYLEAEAYARAALEVLSMREWRIEFSRTPASKSCYAEVVPLDSDMVAVVRFGARQSPWTRYEICSDLVHELLHAFFYQYAVACAMGKPLSEVAQQEEHKLINKLEQIIAGLVFDMVEFEEDEEETEEVIH